MEKSGKILENCNVNLETCKVILSWKTTVRILYEPWR